MQSPPASARVGATISILGALLTISSALIAAGIHPASLGPQVPWLTISPALLILAISAFAWFRTLPRWLLVLFCAISILGILLQLLIYFVNQVFACFDVCTPTNATIGSWILVGLAGFVLSGVGAFITLSRSWSPTS